MDDQQLRERRRIHDETPTFLYELWNDRGVCLYVGVSRTLGRRLSQHATAAWWPQVREVKSRRLPNRRAAIFAEAEAIAELQPVYNWTHTQQAAGSRSGGGHGHVAFRKSDIVPDA